MPKKRKEKNNKKLIVLIIVIAIFLILGVCFAIKTIKTKEENKTPELVHLKICNKEIPIEKGKRIYDISMKECTLHVKNGGREALFEVLFDKDYDATEKSKELEGEYDAYYYIKFDKDDKDSDEEDDESDIYVDNYDYYFNVSFDKPLELEPFN